jgi:hypothetical protein
VTNKTQRKQYNAAVNESIRALPVYSGFRDAFLQHYGIEVTAHKLRAIYVARRIHQEGTGEGRRLEWIQQFLKHRSMNSSRHYNLVQHVPRGRWLPLAGETLAEEMERFRKRLAQYDADQLVVKQLDDKIAATESSTALDDEQKEMLLAGYRHKRQRLV